MATSRPKPFRMAPLQRLTVKEITDPAEQAALDERIKRSRVIDVGAHVNDSAPSPSSKARKKRRQA